MNLSLCEQIFDLTSPQTMLVEWGLVLRSMYLLTGIEIYNTLATRLSIIIESHKGIGYMRVYQVDGLFSALLTGHI